MRRRSLQRAGERGRKKKGGGGDKNVQVRKVKGLGIYHHPLDTRERATRGADERDEPSDKCGWSVNFNGPNLGWEQFANI